MSRKKTSKVQTVLLSRDKFRSKSQVKFWIKNNGFILMKKKKPIDVTKKFYRVRQREPYRFKKLRTKTINKDTKLIIGLLK